MADFYEINYTLLNENGMKEKVLIDNLHLSIEDIDMHEPFSNLSAEQKLALISLVYDLSVAFYNSEGRRYEQRSLPEQ